MHCSFSKPSHWPTTTALVFFLVGTGLAVLQGQHIQSHHNDLKRERFALLADQVVSQLSTRLKTYELGLRSARGAVITPGLKGITRPRFAQFLQSLDLEHSYPGARGLGLIRRVQPGQEAEFLSWVRNAGQPDFQIYAFTPHEHERWVVHYIEPAAENLPAIGVDIASDPVRYQAALESIRQNQPILTPPITLLQNAQDPQNAHNSFLFLLPIYQADMPIDTGDARLKAAQALVYTPLIITEVLEGLDAQNLDFSLSLFDSTNPKQPFYTSVPKEHAVPALLTEQRSLKVYGCEWRIVIQAKPAFIRGLNLIDTRHIVWGLSCLSALVSIFLYVYLVSAIRRKHSLLNQSRIAAIVASSSEAIIGRDLKDRITSWNRAAEQMFGYSAHEVLGQYLSRVIVPPSLWAEEADLLARTHQGQSVSRRITQALKRDGSLLEVEVSLAPIYGSDGRILGSSRTVHDLTEQIQVHHQLELLNQALRERTAQAEAANQSKSEFLANMSHEIRTPMNAILGLCQLLKKQMLPADAQDMLSKIQVAGHALLGIINDILDLSKIEASRLELEHISYSLDEVLDNLATIMAAAQGNKNLELVIMPPPPEACRLKGDPLRLGQILINLVSNAIKFTQQGAVVVEISVQHSFKLNGPCLSFAVRDTGIGISPEKQNSIFAAFTQADSSTSRHFGGTGLGLTICQRLTGLMRGNLQVHSILGQGSTFTLEIPFEPDPLPHTQETPHTTLQVLILDDHPDTRHALACSSEYLGWQAKTYLSGQALLHDLIHAQHPADLLILDWHMPKPDGLQIAAQLHALTGRERLPIVLMCTPQERERLPADTQAQVSAVLTKPVTQNALHNAALSALGTPPHALVEPNPINLDSTQPLRDLHILVVDDGEINREVALALLQDAGAQVTLAESGIQALQILQHSSPQKFQLILMDIQMPQMDGYETAQHIRDIPSLQTLPIIALTAGVCEAVSENTPHFDSCLAKPFEVEALIAVLHKTPLTPECPLPTEPCSTSTPFVDIAQGQKRFGSQQLYAHYLDKFLQEYDGVFSAVPQAQLPAYLHKLKGVAANLSLVKLAEHARKIEQEPPNTQHLSILEKTLQDTRAQIKHYLSQQPETAANLLKTLDETRAQQLSGQIQTALMSLNANTLEGLPELLEVLKAYSTDQQLTSLHQAIENFEFEAAQQALRALAKALNLSLEPNKAIDE